MSESPSESSAWKAFHEQTDYLFEDLIHSSKESLHHNDRFAWLLQQFRFFNRNQIDRTNLANDLYERACEHLNDLRSHIRELMKTLLLICHAPAADKTTLVAWRHQGGYKCHGCGRRVQIVLDGEEWCSHCETYQRPVPHGWSKWEAVSDIPKANA